MAEIYQWGQLGESGSTIPKELSIPLSIRVLSCGEEHIAMISSENQVLTMGSNSDGQLGIGTFSGRSESPMLVPRLAEQSILSVECGFSHTVCLSKSLSVYVWGLGSHGALGTGSTSSICVPTELSLPRVSSISCGSRHSAFLLETLEVMLCGSGEMGQLGTGRRQPELKPVRLNTSGVRQVSCGIFHTGLLTVHGEVFTMGGNSFGQLGQGNKASLAFPTRVRELANSVVDKIAFGGHSACITDTGDLFIWGTGPWGEFLVPSLVKTKVKEVSIGRNFGACISRCGTVHTWGNNSNGELGHGTYCPTESPIHVPYLKNAVSVQCGGTFCIALAYNQDFANCGERDSAMSKSPLRHIDKERSLASTYCTRFFDPVKTESSVNRSINELQNSVNKGSVIGNPVKTESSVNRSINDLQSSANKGFTIGNPVKTESSVNRSINDLQSSFNRGSAIGKEGTHIELAKENQALREALASAQEKIKEYDEYIDILENDNEQLSVKVMDLEATIQENDYYIDDFISKVNEIERSVTMRTPVKDRKLLDTRIKELMQRHKENQQMIKISK